MRSLFRTYAELRCWFFADWGKAVWHRSDRSFRITLERVSFTLSGGPLVDVKKKFSLHYLQAMNLVLRQIDPDSFANFPGLNDLPPSLARDLKRVQFPWYDGADG